MIHFTHPSVSLFLAWTGLVATQIHNLSLSDILIVCGAVGFAIASIRNGRMKILKDTNTDLRERNEQLAAEKAENQIELTKLRSQPNLDQQAKLLGEMTALISEQTITLREIRHAVVPKG